MSLQTDEARKDASTAHARREEDLNLQIAQLQEERDSERKRAERAEREREFFKDELVKAKGNVNSANAAAERAQHQTKVLNEKLATAQYEALNDQRNNERQVRKAVQVDFDKIKVDLAASKQTVRGLNEKLYNLQTADRDVSALKELQAERDRLSNELEGRQWDWKHMNALKQEKIALEEKVRRLRFDREQVVEETLMAVDVEVNPILASYEAKCLRLQEANDLIEMLLEKQKL